MTTDTDRANWIEEHLDSVYTVGLPQQEVLVLKWFDEQGNLCTTSGANLRESLDRGIAKCPLVVKPK